MNTDNAGRSNPTLSALRNSVANVVQGTRELGRSLLAASCAGAAAWISTGWLLSEAYASILGIFAAITCFFPAAGAAWHVKAGDLAMRAAALWGAIVGFGWLAAHLHPAAGVIASLLALAFATPALFPAQPRRQLAAETIRGAEPLLPFKKAQELAAKLCAAAPDDPRISWGGLQLPSKIATTHMLVAGTTGSGKTVNLNLLLKSILPHVGAGRDWRVCIFDAKTEIVSRLHASGVRCPYYILNPFDRRCHAWDMAKDLKAPQDIAAAAKALFPMPDKPQHEFFDRAAGALGKGAMTSYEHRLGDDWEFRDLLLGLSSKRHLREILSWAPQNAYLIEHYLNVNDRTLGDIMATVANHIGRYEVIASFWHHAYKAGRRISLEHWAKSESILILGNSYKAPEEVRELNRVMVRRLSQVILARGESRTRRTWMFFDELAEAGNLELVRFLTQGRDRGLCAVLALQDIALLQQVYGPEVTRAITGQANSKVILRLQEAETALWAQRIFGDFDERSYTANEGTSSGPQGGSTSSGTSERRDTKPLVMASQFLSIPQLGQPGVTALGGYYNTAGIGAYRYDLPLDFVKKHASARSDRDAQLDFHPADEKLGWLEPWTPAELQRLGLPEAEERPRKAATKPLPFSLDGLDVR